MAPNASALINKEDQRSDVSIGTHQILFIPKRKENCQANVILEIEVSVTTEECALLREGIAAVTILFTIGQQISVKSFITNLIAIRMRWMSHAVGKGDVMVRELLVNVSTKNTEFHKTGA